MAEDTSEAAERYANAAFDLAEEAGALDALDADFRLLDAAFAESADLREAAHSPLIEPQEKAGALVAVARKIGISDLGARVIGVAAQNRRAADLPGIARAFRKQLAVRRGARQVEIISARPLTEAQKNEILAALGKSLGAKLEAEAKVDARLIGGFVVRVGSRQFDASLRAKLDALRLSLKSA